MTEKRHCRRRGELELQKQAHGLGSSIKIPLEMLRDQPQR